MFRRTNDIQFSFLKIGWIFVSGEGLPIEWAGSYSLSSVPKYSYRIGSSHFFPEQFNDKFIVFLISGEPVFISLLFICCFLVFCFSFSFQLFSFFLFSINLSPVCFCFVVLLFLNLEAEFIDLRSSFRHLCCKLPCKTWLAVSTPQKLKHSLWNTFWVSFLIHGLHIIMFFGLYVLGDLQRACS